MIIVKSIIIKLKINKNKSISFLKIDILKYKLLTKILKYKFKDKN